MKPIIVSRHAGCDRAGWLILVTYETQRVNFCPQDLTDFLPVRYSALVCFLGVAFAFPLVAQGAKRQSTWTVVESANFRLLSTVANPLPDTVTADLESLRKRIFAYWLEQEHPPVWNPKCDIILHATDASYLAAVGSQGSSTVASSLVDHRDGKRIVVRRIDVRASCGDWCQSALPHELTHVVLADRFVGKTLPRWADEGMAILADPVSKQTRHWEDLQNAMAHRQTFRIVELMDLRDYPAANRWGAFYGQSASLVRFLIERDSPKKFLEFVDDCCQRDSAAALRKVYHLESTAGLERAWSQTLKQKPHLSANYAPGIKSNPNQHTQSDQRLTQESRSGKLLLVSE